MVKIIESLQWNKSNDKLISDNKRFIIQSYYPDELSSVLKPNAYVLIDTKDKIIKRIGSIKDCKDFAEKL